MIKGATDEKVSSCAPPRADARVSPACIAVLCLALSLAGCGGRSANWWDQPGMGPDAAQPIQSNGGSYTISVKPGDTLYSIARRAGVPIRAIIDTNGLTPPYAITNGQRLVVPAGRYYTVRTNDTLYGISRSFGIDMATLAGINDLRAPYIISAGQKLQLPAEAGSRMAASQDVSTGVITPAEPVSGGAQPSGKISASALPPPGKTTTASVAPSSSAANASAGAQPSSGTSLPPLSGGRTVGGAPGDGAGTSASAGSSATLVEPSVSQAPRAVPTSGMMWPVRGRVLSSYGSQAGGTRNDGINISAPAGTQVLAADDGTVAYAGNELKGYGNLLIVKQPNGLMTAYAHNQKLLVDRGALVKKGQPIALVGQTGSVTTPQLHFEVRKGSRAIDPLTVLPGQG